VTDPDALHQIREILVEEKILAADANPASEAAA
jgi:hypothetical protein